MIIIFFPSPSLFSLHILVLPLTQRVFFCQSSNFFLSCFFFGKSDVVLKKANWFLARRAEVNLTEEGGGRRREEALSEQ